MFLFFYNKLGIGSKIQCTLIDVLYCIIRCKFDFYRDFYRVPEKLSGSRQKIKRKNEKGKIELVSKTKN